MRSCSVRWCGDTLWLQSVFLKAIPELDKALALENLEWNRRHHLENNFFPLSIHTNIFQNKNTKKQFTKIQNSCNAQSSSWPCSWDLIIKKHYCQWQLFSTLLNLMINPSLSVSHRSAGRIAQCNIFKLSSQEHCKLSPWWP